MKKIIKQIQEKRWIHYILLLIIGLLIAIPYIYIQLREADDGYVHILRLLSLDLSLNNSKFPFLVTPFFIRNFGYSMVVFYPPMVTYIPYLISKLTPSFYIALKIFASLTIPLSGIFMYNFVNEVTKNKGISFLSAVIYMVVPYHLENLYKRFAMGEFTAYVFIPLVFQGLYNLLQGDKKRHFYITIGAVGVILSHTITTVYTALFCLVYILFHLKEFFKKEVITKCLINVLFIILISAFFIVPMMEFETISHYTIFEPDRMKTGSQYVDKQTIDIREFIQQKQVEGGVCFVIGVPTIIMLSITGLSLDYIDKKYKKFYLIFIFLGLICLLMCTKFFPWKYMPQILCNIQYPWRLIGFAMFFLSPVMAMNVYCLLNNVKKDGIKNSIYILVLIVIGVFTVLRLATYLPKDINTDEIYENTKKANPFFSHWNINREYLPYKANIRQMDYLNYRKDRVYVLSGEANIENENKQGLDLTFDIKNASKDTMLELPYIFYPGYEAEISDEGNIEIIKTSESQNGFVQITLPNEVQNGVITVKYEGTMLDKVSYVISAISLIGFIIYIIYFKRKTKNEI